ncbi:MAG: PH domain-containing protein [Chloroflexi bacterium]|nr:PH domain-containing protein [Chloroflexota bacterium]
MNDSIFIDPPRRAGYVFHIITIVFLITLGGYMINQAIQMALGPVFILLLLGGLFTVLPVPILSYRLYALYRSGYTLGRDGVHLRWGLREESIPMTEIDWVRLDTTLDYPLKLPRIRWPGGLLGVRTHKDMGEVEYLASRQNRLVLIGTKKGVYAISPPDQETFIQAFRQQIELGSLDSFEARSVYPTFLLAEIWKSRLGRYLLLTGLALNLALLIWVGIAVPNQETISLGFAPNGALLPPVAGVQLFLLPILSVFFLMANFVTAVYFNRRNGDQPLSYLMWASNIVTAAIFLSAVYFILRVS